MSLINSAYYIFLSVTLIQSCLLIYFNAYIWLNEERLESIASPQAFVPAHFSFSVLLPAYHEEEVLGETIAQVARMNYPKKKFEILIILQPSDRETIRVAYDAIKHNRIKNARVLLVDPLHTPLNKPYQMNFALQEAKCDRLVIFDSEDEVHPDILHVANTIYRQKKVDIIQAGVQLVNYYDRWFSSHNVLEYFFWFKSRMHAHMRIGAVPLGGNTVFFNTQQLKDIGGWNEGCLTEDAEIGLRLSAKGAKMFATYDAQHVTREETPLTVGQFIKQRTRWCQGFIQILRARTYNHLPKKRQQLMALYLLGFPIAQAVLFAFAPIVLVIGLTSKLPFLISLMSFVPMFLLVLLLAIQVVGLFELIREQKLKFKIRGFLSLIFLLLPYQILLAIGALRAIWRELRRQGSWEKTAHVGAHRVQAAKPGVTS